MASDNELKIYLNHHLAILCCNICSIVNDRIIVENLASQPHAIVPQEAW